VVLKTQVFGALCIPVMKRWSTGAFVAEWDPAIQKEPPAPVPSGEKP